MKFTSAQEIQDFLAAVQQCQEAVWLFGPEGDRYNLKSELSQYVAIGALLREKGKFLELVCASKDDETYFAEFFHKHPEVNTLKIS